VGSSASGDAEGEGGAALAQAAWVVGDPDRRRAATAAASLETAGRRQQQKQREPQPPDGNFPSLPGGRLHTIQRGATARS